MIKVYDNIFSYDYSCFVWNFVKGSLYKIGWLDDSIPEHSEYLCLHSVYNEEDQNRLEIRKRLDDSEVGSLIKDKMFVKMVVNLSIPGQTHFEHTHTDDFVGGAGRNIERSDNVVCLYYPALEWKRQWGGETMFYTADNLELEKAVEYRSNRLVFFTGDHSHSVRPSTLHAPFYRFTISMFFTEV